MAAQTEVPAKSDMAISALHAVFAVEIPCCGQRHCQTPRPNPKVLLAPSSFEKPWKDGVKRCTMCEAAEEGKQKVG